MRLRSFLDALLRRSKLEEGMDAEMRFHVESFRDDLIRSGVPAQEAARRAYAEFGALEARKEECREARGLRWPGEIAQDLTYGLRSLRKNFRFAAVTIVTLALGIGANTAIFSVLEAVLLRPLPYPEANRLVVVREANQRGESFSVTWPDFDDWRTQSKSFAGMTAFVGQRLELTGIARPVLLSGANVSAAFFPLLGVKTQIGRAFSESEDRPGAVPVVVLSDALWHNAFGGDPTILGKSIDLNGAPYVVIGVAAPGQEYGGGALDAYLPIGLRAADPSFNNRAAHGSMHVLARLAAGKNIEAASADLDTIMARLAKQFPQTNAGHRVWVRKLEGQASSELKPVFYALLFAVGLVLLIACANVANLLLARAADRRRELAVRASLGASGARIARQMMTESLLLALAGGAAGLALAAATLGPLVHFAPRGIPHLDRVHMDSAVLGFNFAISLATGFLFGFAPALQASRAHVNDALKDGGRNLSSGRARQRIRSGLLIAEVSLASLLLVVSALLLRSLGSALARDPGFQPERLVALDVVLLNPKYKQPAAVARFLSEAMESIRRTPGIQAAGSAKCPPLAADCGDYWYEVPGRTHFTPGNADDSLYNVADSGYFPAIGASILEGRNFDSSDDAGSRPTAIINQTLARKWWPHDSPVGSQIKFGGPGEKGPLYTIVGVVRDINRDGLDTAPEPEIFLAAGQASDGSLAILVRSSLDPSQAASVAERAIHSVDRDLPVRASTVTRTMAESLGRRKFLTALLAVFGALALSLAGIGVFGVVAYQAAQQTHEIGLRKALGAETRDIVWLFARRAAAPVLTGAALGVAGSLALSHVLAGLLFRVKPWDPVTLICAPTVLAALAFLASYLPARSAARLDAMTALRQE
ncbi:MAG TPA: ABC transporter permease [Bryobacteraceae bacterium]|nr:ABC transporter permease [Bryobacteraceae bacterium]